MIVGNQHQASRPIKAFAAGTQGSDHRVPVGAVGEDGRAAGLHGQLLRVDGGLQLFPG